MVDVRVNDFELAPPASPFCGHAADHWSHGKTSLIPTNSTAAHRAFGILRIFLDLLLNDDKGQLGSDDFSSAAANTALAAPEPWLAAMAGGASVSIENQFNRARGHRYGCEITRHGKTARCLTDIRE